MTIANLLDESEDDLPALYHHCVTVYEKMFSKSERDETTGVVVYEGFIHKLVVRELGMAGPLYTYSTRALKDMGCIKQVRRGGGSSPSLWRLITKPTPGLFRGLPKGDQTSSARLSGAKSVRDQFAQQVTSLNTRVAKLEEAVVVLVKGNRNLTERIIALEEERQNNA